MRQLSLELRGLPLPRLGLSEWRPAIFRILKITSGSDYIKQQESELKVSNIKFALEMAGIALVAIVVLFAVYVKMAEISVKKRK